MTATVEVPRAGPPAEPSLRLLLVGKPGGVLDPRLESLGHDRRFGKVRVVSPEQLEVADASDAAELGSTNLRECLVVVWDLEALSPSGDVLVGETVGERLAAASRWSVQRVVFGFAEATPRLSFLELVELVEQNLVFVGGFDGCTDALRRWCGGGGEPGILLRPFKKLPSRWLRNLRHDYLAGALSMFVRPALEELAFVADQRLVDFWQDALRNLLIHTRTNYSCRCSPGSKLEDEPEVVRRSASTPFRLIVPSWVGDALRARGEAEGEQFVSYDRSEEAIAQAGTLAAEGVAHVLLWTRDDPPELPGVSGSSAPAPVVLVGEESPRASWTQWQGYLRRNVLGGYGRDELLGRDQPEGSILDLKPSRWRPFCFRSVPEVFGDLGDVMSRTIEALRPRIGEEQRSKLAWSLAEIEAAQELYLGPAEPGHGGGEQ